MIDRDPPHYLRPLKTTTVPKRLLWLDCEHQTTTDKGIRVDRWESGVLGTTHFTARAHERKDTMRVFDSPRELWEAADAFCTSGRRVVLWAHDLAYQLRVSQALLHLPALGWHLEKIVLERTASWCLLRNGDRSLMCCDLQSWVAGGIDHLEGDLAAVAEHKLHHTWKPPNGSVAMTRRAHVIREVTLQILDWIEHENLGQFRPTGSGQSYTAFRRRFLHDNILVHDDAERLHMERIAMWTGRCEAWQHGTLSDGPFIEYDMQAAYCRIAAECEVPIVARHTVIKATVPLVKLWMKTWAVLADVTVTTDVPCVPTSMGGRTVWPVGTFRTILWDPELELVFKHAQNVTIHNAYRYERGSALQDFAHYVLGNLDPSTIDTHPIVRRVVKHWSRCLVGRLGLRYRAWEKYGTQPEHDLRLVTYVDSAEGVKTDVLIAGADRLILGDMSEALESVPQIPSWVMSECRRRLWETMQWFGFEHIVYCDTDSIITAAVADGGINDYINASEYGTWSDKGKYSRVTIHGPRNLVCETDRRVAGLPLTARQTAPLEFSGQVMRSIKESMRAGELDCVASLPRTWVLDAPDLRRQHLADHKTAPFEVHQQQQEDDRDASSD